MQIFATGLDVGGLITSLGDKGKELEEAAHAQLQKAALLVQREARRNAPRSPTQAQKNALKKTNRKGKRNNRATSRANPGGLERSIEQKVYPGLEAEIFVAANSEAGKYATKMHDGKGSSWRNRGPGTRAKARRAPPENSGARAVQNHADRFRRKTNAATATNEQTDFSA